MVIDAEAVVVNHRGYADPGFVKRLEYMIHNHWISIAHHKSQPIAQLSTPNNNHWLIIAKQLVVNSGVLC
jgi:hypothetical protein